MKGAFREDRRERGGLFRCRKDAVKDVLSAERKETEMENACRVRASDGKNRRTPICPPASPPVSFSLLRQSARLREGFKEVF